MSWADDVPGSCRSPLVEYRVVVKTLEADRLSKKRIDLSRKVIIISFADNM